MQPPEYEGNGQRNCYHLTSATAEVTLPESQADSTNREPLAAFV